MSDTTTSQTPLPPYLEPLPGADAQRALDAWAIDQRGIPGERLMERAGSALADQCARLVPRGLIVVICGGGNNGGDGLVAARVLRDTGREVRVLLTADPEKYKGDAKLNLDRLPGEPPELFNADALEGASGVIDAMLGTGFAGVPREPVAGAITALNRLHGRAHPVVVACDVPSGVDASTGQVSWDAVRSDATVSFHASKPGHWIAPGKRMRGDLTIVDIGIPTDEADSGVPIRSGLIRDEVLKAIPRRDSEDTKFSAGNVAICGGSRGLSGAPVLAGTGAARAGAGYVTVLVPDRLVEVMELKLLEVMSKGLPEADGAISADAVSPALEALGRSDVLVLGPGLGRAGRTRQFVNDLLAAAALPVVLDADGLNALDGREGLQTLKSRPAPTVLTPHAGELSRLLETSSDLLETRRYASVCEAAQISGCVTILKGDDTLVAAPDGRVAISAGGAPMLASAGTGDVLGGVIGALLAKGLEPFTAACAGVHLHLRAGQVAGRGIGTEGVLASDVVNALPKALGDGSVEI